MQNAAANLANAVNRPKDVSSVIDRLQQLDREDGPLHGRLDCERIGMAGHSFRPYTTLAIAGEAFPGLRGWAAMLADPRVRAAVPMSAPVPKRRDKLEQAFGSIKIPCLHMTGTLDDSPVGETKAADRRLPFDHIHLADQYLVTFNGGDHMIFSGRPPVRKDGGPRLARRRSERSSVSGPDPRGDHRFLGCLSSRRSPGEAVADRRRLRRPAGRKRQARNEGQMSGTAARRRC